MRSFSLTLRSASLFGIITLMSACTSSDPAESSSTSINTEKLFTADIVIPAGDDLTGLYSFNSDNARSAERARFYQGDNMFFEMNTDQSLQGWEYMAYVYQNEDGHDAVYVYNYSKSASKKITELWDYDGEICSILPVLSGNQTIYDDQERHKAKLSHRKQIYVEVPQTPAQACDPLLNLRIEISFEKGLNAADINIAQRTSIARGLMIDYEFSETVTDSNGNSSIERGRDARVFDNRQGAIEFKGIIEPSSSTESSEETLYWSTVIADNSDIVFAEQVSNTHVLLQTATDLYIALLSELFSFDSLSSSVPDTIDRILFENSRHTLEVPNVGSSVLVASNGADFIIRDNDSLYLYRDEIFEKIYELPPTVVSIELTLLDDGDIYIAQHYNGFSTLASAIKAGATWDTSTSLLGGLSSEQLLIDSIDDNLYVSTFNLGPSEFGWHARVFSAGVLSEGPFENTQFLVSNRIDQTEKTPYILASDDVDANAFMIEPTLHDYDEERADGRKLELDSNENTIRDSDGNAVTLNYGSIGSTIQNASVLVVVNDSYAYFDTLNDDDSQEKQFVDLSENDASSIRRMWTSDVD